MLLLLVAAKNGAGLFPMNPGRLNVKKTLMMLTVASAVMAGCVPSYPVGKGDLDRYWLLTDMATGTRPATPKAAEGFRMPTRWVIRADDDPDRAGASITRAMAMLREGTDEIEFSVSGAHAAAIVTVLQDIRAGLDRLEEMIDTAGRSSKNEWAAALAAALVKAEAVSRPFTAEPGAPGPDPGRPAKPSHAAAQPMLHMITMYLNEQAQGGLLGELTTAEKRRLRDVLAGVMVQVGFEVAGKTATAQVRREVVEMMRSRGDLPTLQADLTGRLTERIAAAPPARSNGKRQIVHAALRWGPKVIGLMEAFLSQWDRMDSITVEMFARRGRTAIGATIAAKPGKPVRIADVVTGMPTIVLTGAARLIAQPDATGAGETVVSFESGKEGGAVEVHYEGATYAMVRMLAIPLASGPLREIRLSHSSPIEGEQLVNIAVLSEAADDKADPRRMIVVQHATVKRLVREAFDVRTVTDKSETVVNYITPRKRYTYLREKGP